MLPYFITGFLVKAVFPEALHSYLKPKNHHLQAGRKRAEGRHAFLLEYLEHFQAEWEGRL
jgi:hypothetical protein